jgi:hypothetical protein
LSSVRMFCLVETFYSAFRRLWTRWVPFCCASATLFELFSYVEFFTVAGTVMATAPTVVTNEDKEWRMKKMDRREEITGRRHLFPRLWGNCERKHLGKKTCCLLWVLVLDFIALGYDFWLPIWRCVLFVQIVDAWCVFMIFFPLLVSSLAYLSRSFLICTFSEIRTFLLLIPILSLVAPASYSFLLYSFLLYSFLLYSFLLYSFLLSLYPSLLWFVPSLSIMSLPPFLLSLHSLLYSSFPWSLFLFIC